MLIIRNFQVFTFHLDTKTFRYLDMRTGLALITTTEARLWTDGRYFLQATQELSDQWTLMRMGEDPTVDIWMADVSFYFRETILFIIWKLKRF